MEENERKKMPDNKVIVYRPSKEPISVSNSDTLKTPSTSSSLKIDKTICRQCSKNQRESLDTKSPRYYNDTYALDWQKWTKEELNEGLCFFCFLKEDREKAIHNHEHIFITDEWDESLITLKWKKIATFLKGVPVYSRTSYETKHVSNHLLLKIECHSNIPKIKIDSNNNLGKKLEASLLFENDSVSTLRLEKPPKSDYYLATLSAELLKNFQNLNLVKWKFTSQNKDIVWSGSFKQNEKYLILFKQEDYQEALKSYANEFDNILSKKSASWKENLLEEIKPSFSGPEETEELEECHVYLMKDTSNGFYKIGVSNKPEYRERTLQSEKPTIELITSKSYPSREMALAIEKAMHNLFEKKRLRGEWFKLSSSDVNQVKESLK
ncbi:MAG: GIY-YIG nuclease family protein [Chitinophagales bacterium]